MGPRKELINESNRESSSNPDDNASGITEARYRRLFESAKDGILIIDADTGRITDVNPFLADLLGYLREDFIGKRIWGLGPFKDIRASKSAFQDLMRSGYIRYEHLPLEAKDGRRIEVEVISNLYGVGHKRTVQCNIRDISQRKQAEKASLMLESQLKQVQKMTAIATLAGGVAHQFNNALTVLTGGLGVLEMRESCQQTGDKCLQLMKNAVDKMSRLTQQLLAFARGGKYSLETMSLSDLVRDSMPLLKAAVQPSIGIETELPAGVPQTRVDKAQMQMAMCAILANASEAIEEHGLIRITCRREVMTDQRAKAFAGLRPGIYASLTITDNGQGMDAETRDRVFEPFFTTRFPGRGLGMAAAYGIVKNHDGWISIESAVNQGTVVSIYLPAVGLIEESAALPQLPMQSARQATSF